MRIGSLASSAVLLAAALAACRDTAPPAPSEGQVASDEAVGGSRLKARWVGGPDGPVAPLPAGAPFLDEALGEPCDFGLATDGVLRCLAGYVRGAVFMRSLGDGPRWADPGCTVQVIDRTPTCAPQPRWLAGPASTACPPTVRVRTPGVRLAPGSPIYQLTATGCIPSTSTAGNADWTLVEEDPAIFVPAALEDGPAEGGFAVRRVVAEDGASLALGLRPAGEGWAGVPTRGADGSTRLLPEGPELWPFGGSADAACTTPAMSGSGCFSAGDLGRVWRQIDACQGGYAAYVLGPRIEQQYLGSACTASPVGAVPVFAAAERPLASLPEATPAPATARLQQAGFCVGSRWRWRQGQVVDATLGAEVQQRITSDGVRRWVPAWALWFDPVQGAATAWTFADPACTVRLLAYTAALCRAPDRWALEQETLACDSAVSAWTTEPWSGAGLYARTGPGGPCVAAAPDPALRFVRLVAPAPDATFAPATELLR